MNYKRVFVPNSCVHLIVVAYNRKDIFVENIELLRASFKNAKQHFGFDIIAICVLPNHIHMILNPDNIKVRRLGETQQNQAFYKNNYQNLCSLFSIRLLFYRNINIDIIKCLAVFFVISIHFFLNNNFYNTVIDCPRMYIMCYMRTFFMICIPLFLLITGFLMHKKELSIKYYRNLNNIIIPYIIISIITLIARIALSKYGIFTLDSWEHYINEFIDFHLIGYGWYVDMYIGLYLLIPFINKIFTNKQI